MDKELDRRTLREILESYCKRGWFLFPIKRETKKPAITDNLKEASTDIETLMEWARRFPNCNWGVSLAKSGMVAVDIDEKGLNKWGALTIKNGAPDTLRARSGSGLGLHFFFKAEAGVRYRGKIGEGIDVKHNGYVVLYPSIHPNTKKQYRFENDEPVKRAPEWLRKLIEKTKEDLPEKKEPAQHADFEFFEKIATQLAEKSFGYQEWVKIGMALHAAFNGGEEGFKLYSLVTQGVNYAEGDLDKARYKWETFKPGGGVSGGTFVHVARELGCDIPNPDLEEDLETFKELSLQDDLEAEIAQAREPTWHMDALDRKFTGNMGFLVSDLNEQGYAVLRGSAEGSIIRYWTDDNGVGAVKLFTLGTFKTALADHHYKVFEGVKVKRPKLLSAGDLWLKNSKRKSYTEIVFRPNAPASALNLWSPIPCLAEPGNVTPLLSFIENIICSGDKPRSEYLLDWVAHAAQKPAEKCTIVPVLIGNQGTGKGLFTDGILGAIFKNYYCRIDKPGVIKERFNVEQSRKFITILDEASWRGDVELSNILKSLTGNATMTVEEKYGGRYTIENYSRYIVTSNDIEAVRIEPTNRRYLTFNVSPAQLRNLDYYATIYEELENGKLEAHFFDFLLRRDISHFKPKQFPTALDTGGDKTKVASLGPVGAFWYDHLFENPVPMFHEGTYLLKNEVFQIFLAYCENTRQWKRGLSQEWFWRETRAIMPNVLRRETRTNSGARRIKIFPYDLAREFCTYNRITMPDTFDELELMVEHDFREDDASPPPPEKHV